MGDAVIERMEDASRLQWAPVVRFFVGGPLDGRAIEGADSREWEAGPMAVTSDYWHDGWILYTPSEEQPGGFGNPWIVYQLEPAVLLSRAKRKYVVGEIDLAEFEQAVNWALLAEGSTFQTPPQETPAKDGNNGGGGNRTRVTSQPETQLEQGDPAPRPRDGHA